MRSKRPILAMAGAGVLWALALLTKIHAWFLLPILGAWSFVWLPPRRAHCGHAGLDGRRHQLVLAGLALALVRFVEQAPGVLGDGRRAVDDIMVQYFGQVVADRDVPWHYPWFYFAATVPIGLLALGAVGIVRGWSDRRADPFPLLLAGHDRGLPGHF